jgi:DNA-binding NarL/FixJ family response regulator
MPVLSQAAMQKPLRLLLADDHEMVRVAMRQALAPLADTIEWHEAADAVAAERSIERNPDLDLAILDLHMPGAGDIQWIASLRERQPTVPLLVLSGDEDPQLVRSLIDLGVAGFIPKSDSAAVILQAVRLVLSGGTYAPLRLMARGDGAEQPRSAASAGVGTMGLTSRQVEVLRLLARGLPNKLIARELAVSEGTVKVHLLAIFRTLGVHNRTQAVVEAQKRLRANGPTAADAPGVPGNRSAS